MDNVSHINFSPSLAGPASDGLRQAIIGALNGVLPGPLLVETVFDAAGNPACACSDNFYLWYLLLDVHRAFLYRRGDKFIGADSIARFILDDYQSENYEELKQYFQCHGFKNVHDFRRLEILRALHGLVTHNSAVMLDFISGDIRFSPGRLHAEMADGADWELHEPAEELEFVGCVVGQKSAPTGYRSSNSTGIRAVSRTRDHSRRTFSCTFLIAPDFGQPSGISTRIKHDVRWEGI